MENSDYNLLREFIKATLSEDKRWIQKAFNKIKKKGTEGRCTGDKFGSESCPTGSKEYNMAKNLKGLHEKDEKIQKDI